MTSEQRTLLADVAHICIASIESDAAQPRRRVTERMIRMVCDHCGLIQMRVRRGACSHCGVGLFVHAESIEHRDLVLLLMASDPFSADASELREKIYGMESRDHTLDLLRQRVKMMTETIALSGPSNR